MNKNIIPYHYYLIVFLLIANSGLPFFTNNPNILVASLLFTLLFLRHAKNINFSQLVFTLFILLIVSLGQIITTGIFDLRSILTLMIRWSYPFIVIAVVGEKFVKVFINVMYFLTIVSLLIFVPTIFFPQLDDILLLVAKYFDQKSTSEFYDYNRNILVYTISPIYALEGIGLFKRNAGPFWEAGGFGSYLIVTLLFSIVKERKIASSRNILFMIALITTWSTAALTALLILISAYGIMIRREKVYRLLLIPMIAVSFFYIYSELSFVSERVDGTINYFRESDKVYLERRDRAVSAIVDFRTWTEFPIFGTGRNIEARYGREDKTYLEHRNNGISDFLVKYGILFFVYYFMMLKLSFSNYARFVGLQLNNRFGYIALIVIFVIGFAQGLFQQSVFIALFFLKYLYEKNGTNTI